MFHQNINDNVEIFGIKWNMETKQTKNINFVLTAVKHINLTIYQY